MKFAHSIVAGVLATLLSFCLFGCSKQHTLPDLSQWFKKSDSSPEMVHLDGKLFAALLRNESGDVDRLCLTDGADVILAVEVYGNGRAINIASAGMPGLLVQQGASGIDVSRYLQLPGGAMKQVVYGADGHVIEERQIPGSK